MWVAVMTAALSGGCASTRASAGRGDSDPGATSPASSPLYGYFCSDTQEARDSFTWVRQAGQLQITGGSTCADRDALFDGNWEGGR